MGLSGKIILGGGIRSSERAGVPDCYYVSRRVGNSSGGLRRYAPAPLTCEYRKTHGGGVEGAGNSEGPRQNGSGGHINGHNTAVL